MQVDLKGLQTIVETCSSPYSFATTATYLYIFWKERSEIGQR